MNILDRAAAMARENAPDVCWEWPGFRVHGYGVCGANLDAKGWRRWPAHRAIYTILVGAVPPELHLDHLCRNRGCVNPAHLEPVTPRENVLRSPVAATALNARKTHCEHGHEFTPENTRAFRSKYGPARGCRMCERASYERTRIARGKPLNVGKGHRPTPSHCKNGHPFDEANTIHRKSGRVACRACNREHWKRYAKQRRAEQSDPNRTHCKAGHLLTEANTYIGSGGSRHCRACHAAAMHALGVKRRQKTA